MNDYRYFSFQTWQEGLARYTEYKYLELLDDYAPTKEVTALPDYESFQSLKTRIFKREVQNLPDNRLNEARRVCFYSTGFAEGLILDRLSDSWRDRYLTEKFYIERYSEKYR